jgi:hypothetical protein
MQTLMLRTPANPSFPNPDCRSSTVRSADSAEFLSGRRWFYLDVVYMLCILSVCAHPVCVSGKDLAVEKVKRWLVGWLVD